MNIFVLLLLRLFFLIPGRFWFSIWVQDYNISNDLVVLLLLVNRVLLPGFSSFTDCRLFLTKCHPQESIMTPERSFLIQNAVTKEPWPVTSVLISSNSSVKHKKLGFIYTHNTNKSTILNLSPIFWLPVFSKFHHERSLGFSFSFLISNLYVILFVNFRQKIAYFEFIFSSWWTEIVISQK